MAHKKGLGSSRNGRDSNPKYLGVKVFAGQRVGGGEIIVRQRGTALRTGLPRAVRVLDAFHVTRLGFAAVDDVRRRVQQESTGHRGRTVSVVESQS